MALRIAKDWNRDPDWFYNLDSDIQIKVIAEWRLSNSSPDEIKDRQANIKRAKMEAMIAKSIGEGNGENI